MPILLSIVQKWETSECPTVVGLGGSHPRGVGHVLTILYASSSPYAPNNEWKWFPIESGETRNIVVSA